MNYNKYFPIQDYYRKVIIPLNPKRFHLSSGGKMVCPMHEDHDPSMGVVGGKDKELCHCFGCGYWGDIIKLHKDISRRYNHRVLSNTEALRELCRLFGVNYDVFSENKKAEEKSLDEKRMNLISAKQNEFDTSDFSYLFVDGKRKGKGIGYFNALMMSMIWELKKGEE